MLLASKLALPPSFSCIFMFRTKHSLSRQKICWKYFPYMASKNYQYYSQTLIQRTFWGCVKMYVVANCMLYQGFTLLSLQKLPKVHVPALFLKMSHMMPTSMSVCISACLSAYQHVCLSVCLSACLPICLPACLFVDMPICLPVCQPVCLPACLLTSMSVCISACLSACLPAC